MSIETQNYEKLVAVTKTQNHTIKIPKKLSFDEVINDSQKAMLLQKKNLDLIREIETQQDYIQITSVPQTYIESQYNLSSESLVEPDYHSTINKKDPQTATLNNELSSFKYRKSAPSLSG